MDCDIDCEWMRCRICDATVSACYVRRNCTGEKPPDSRTGGPGTELKKLLAQIGIKATANCTCNARAREMDAWGIDEAARPERIEEAVGWLREEAAKRKLPFLDAAGRLLIKRAISNARRASRGQGQGEATV
jgi:hypothetical protein